MEEIIKIFQNYKDESDENREKAILSAIKILVRINQDRKEMKEQLGRASREIRRHNKGLIASKQLICNYIDLVEASIEMGGTKDEQLNKNGEK